MPLRCCSRLPLPSMKPLPLLAANTAWPFRCKTTCWIWPENESSIGKPVGGDLREGKATLPVLYLLDGPHADEVREHSGAPRCW